MDGLLLDTERIALATFEAACRAHGLVVERAIYERCIGTSMQGTRDILARRLDTRLTIGSAVSGRDRTKRMC